MADAQKPQTAGTSSDKKSLAGAVDAFLRGHMMKVDGCLPAQVVSYDRAKNVATVQPLINWVLTDDSTRERNEIVEVPVLSLGGGGFHVNFPLAAGNLGWIIAADRDLSLFLQTLKSAKPPTSRFHSFSDSLFIPDVFRQYTVAGEDSGAMVIQSTDGNTKISIRNDNILIAAPTKVLVRVPLTEFSQDVKIDGNLTTVGNSTTQGNSTVQGATQVNGGFSAAGGQPCTLPATTTVNGKTVNGHQHTNPEGGNVGPF